MSTAVIPWGRAIPSPIGDLNRYITAISQFPLLSEAEELECGRKARDHGDVPSITKLVLSHLRFVVSLTRKLAGYDIPHGDLIQEGNVGLIKAAQKFDPDRGVRFVSFAAYYIISEVYDYIVSNWSIVKLATSKPQRKLFFRLRSLMTAEDKGRLSRESAQKIADELNVPLRDVLEMHYRFTGKLTGDLSESRQQSDYDGEDHGRDVLTLLKDPTPTPEEQFFEEFTNRANSENIKLALDKLEQFEPRLRTIIERRFLGEEPETLSDIAKDLKVSTERVRQLETKALRFLRKQL